jgi:hypothetical protein
MDPHPAAITVFLVEQGKVGGNQLLLAQFEEFFFAARSGMQH